MIVTIMKNAEQLAALAWDLARGESRFCQVAIMHLAVNRHHGAVANVTLKETCDALRRERDAESRQAPEERNSRVESPGSESLADDPLYQRLCDDAQDILLGLTVDPTGGAVRFHRHTVCPDWSAGFQPTALIGPYFFYATAAGDVGEAAILRENKKEMAI